MSSLRDEARRLAEEAAQRMTNLNNRPSTSIIESALLAFAKLVMEREPSETAIVIGWAALKPRTTAEDCTDLGGAYRAMARELLRELEEGSNIESHQPKEQP